MKKFALVFILLSSVLLAEDKPQPSQYDTWLQNEGYYLLDTQQKEKFRAMTDTEKELYIRNLWASLDPDPITPENEFQDEYMKRFAYAQKNFHIPSDRAKVYLLLGQPNEVERHPSDDKFYPLELWSYYSLGVKGLPPSLDLIFFKRWGTGDYKLYSPLFDGLKALTPSQMDFQNPKVMAQVKAYFDSQIVEASQHLSTGANQMESEEVRMRLQDPDIIQRTQKQRATVETTVVYEGFQADIYTYPVPSRDGTSRTSIAVAIPPKYVTFEKTETQYQARIDLIGRITDARGNEILRINDSPAIKLSDADFEKARAYYFSYIFDAYLLPGKYNLDCLFRDYASNGAGKMDKSFEILEPKDDLELLPPMIAIKSAPSKEEEMPFGYEWHQYYPKENITFGVGQTLTLYTRLLNPKRLPISGTWHLAMILSRGGENEMETGEDIPVDSTTSDVEINRRIRLQSLIPGTYMLTLKLSQDQLSFESSAPLKISQVEEQFGRVRISPTATPPPEYYHTNLALQYYFQGNAEEAAKHVRIALDFAPSHYAARGLSARILKLKGDTDGAIAAYEKLIQEQPTDAEGYFLIGKWSLEKQDWRTASEMLQKAMAGGYYTIELLNGLASAQLHLGNPGSAVDYWQKSLALDSHQPEIEQQLATHKQ